MVSMIKHTTQNTDLARVTVLDVLTCTGISRGYIAKEILSIASILHNNFLQSKYETDQFYVETEKLKHNGVQTVIQLIHVLFVYMFYGR